MSGQEWEPWYTTPVPRALNGMPPAVIQTYRRLEALTERTYRGHPHIRKVFVKTAGEVRAQQPRLLEDYASAIAQLNELYGVDISRSFANNAPPLIRKSIDLYQEYLTTSLWLASHHKNYTYAFIQNAPVLLKKAPCQYQEYKRKAEWFESKDSELGISFCEWAAKAMVDSPAAYETGLRTGMQLAEMDSNLSWNLFRDLYLMYKKSPHHAHELSRLVEERISSDTSENEFLVKVLPPFLSCIPKRHVTPWLDALMMLPHETLTRQEFLHTTTPMMPGIKRDVSPQQVLLEYVHDAKSACVVRPLLDMKDPDLKAAYKQKIRRFY